MEEIQVEREKPQDNVNSLCGCVIDVGKLNCCLNGGHY